MNFAHKMAVGCENNMIQSIKNQLPGNIYLKVY